MMTIDTANRSPQQGRRASYNNNDYQRSKQDDDNESTTTTASARKRTKASRACDQCRKKKIKCDYLTNKESKHGNCTSCEKIGEVCTFQKIQMKRGPSKGYTRSNSSSNHNYDELKRTFTTSTVPPPLPMLQTMGSTKPGSLLLPALSQYMPHAGPNVQNNLTQQQPFWKVPYHGFTHQNIDSVTSSSASKDQQSVYSPHHNYNPEEPPSIVSRHRSSSLPPVIRKASSSTAGSQTHQQQVLNYPAGDINGFPHLASSEFRQRNDSITSDSVSNLSTPTGQIQTPLYSTDRNMVRALISNEQTQRPGIGLTQIQRANDLSNNVIEQQSNLSPTKLSPLVNTNDKQVQSRPMKRRISSTSTKQSKSRRRASSKMEPQADTAAQWYMQNALLAKYVPVSSSTHSNNLEDKFEYGKIADIRLVDIYYEFIHVGFPIIPLNKSTLTNDILLINTQPISSIHEINNFVILWFRNSLELLVRAAIRKDNPVILEISNSVQAYTLAIDECFQNLLGIYHRIKENSHQISSKVKVIYLSTLILLNYTAAYTAYDGSFMLGMTVTIFNDLNMFRYLQFMDDPIPNTAVSLSVESSGSSVQYSVVFRRMYILLIILDSMKSCILGVPKQISISILNLTGKLFGNNKNEAPDEEQNSKWMVDEYPKRVECILQSLKMGELLTELSLKRQKVEPLDMTFQDITERLSAATIYDDAVTSGSDESYICYTRYFMHILIQKRVLIQSLLSLVTYTDDGRMTFARTGPPNMFKVGTDTCTMVSLVLKCLTHMMRLNPTNSIDFDYRPFPPGMEATAPPTAAKADTQVGKGSTNDNSPSTNAAACNSNEFYKKLLGLGEDSESMPSDVCKGSISPFSIAVVHELYNVVEVVKGLPTVIINLVMAGASENQTGAATDDLNFTALKPQELVMSLSACMSEVVQITSLLNIVKPFKGFGSKQVERPEMVAAAYKTQAYDGTSSIYRKVVRQFQKEVTTQDMPARTQRTTLLKQLVETAFKLMDDAEVGWVPTD